MESQRLHRAMLLKRLTEIVEAKKKIQAGSMVDMLKTAQIMRLMGDLCTVENKLLKIGYNGLSREQAVDLAKMYYNNYRNYKVQHKRKLTTYYSNKLDELAADYHLEVSEYALY